MSLETEVTYQYLEPRAHPWRKILWITGRNMHVWHLVATMLREGETPEEAARNFGLPVEAVREALDYYRPGAMQNGPRLSLALRDIDHQLTRRGRIKASIPVAPIESDVANDRVILGATNSHVVAVFSKQLVIACVTVECVVPIAST